MIRQWIKEYIQKLFIQLIQQTFVLRPEDQYLLIVKDDATARDLHEACTKYLDLENGPRLAIVVAQDVKMVQLSVNKSEN